MIDCDKLRGEVLECLDGFGSELPTYEETRICFMLRMLVCKEHGSGRGT